MKIMRFEDLEIWKTSISVAKDIYNISSKKTFFKDFSLRDQIRRAIVSVSSNIAEGFEKNNNNELIHYLKISKGSLGEVRSQLYIALTLNYVNKPEFDILNNNLLNLASQLGKFISYLSQKRRNREFLTH